MTAKKTKPKKKDVSQILENVEKPTYKIVKNANTFELHRIRKGKAQKVFIQADTNQEDFEKACKKFQK